MTRPGATLTAPLTDPEFYAGDPWPHYERLRAEAPVAWNDELGFWALVRHHDVSTVSRDPARFCSSQGVLLADIGRELPDVPGALLYVDPPAHGRYRRLVQPAFLPSRVRALEPRIRERTRGLLDEVVTGGKVDVVDTFALPLPLLVVADLLGLPTDLWRRYAAWSDAAIAAGTEQTDEHTVALIEMTEFLLAAVADKRAAPGDDLISVLATASVPDPDTGEPDQLDDGELMMFCIQLLVAGNETTRNLVSGGLVALAEHPEQWQALRDDPARVPIAVDELLRWTSPVTSFLRTATVDAEVGGQRIEAGERVLLLYAAANRDPEVFDDPGRLDVTRNPNHHLAFGFGEHFCIGAGLARLEGRIVLEELLGRVESIEPAGRVRRLASAGVVAGVLEAPLRFELAR